MKGWIGFQSEEDGLGVLIRLNNIVAIEDDGNMRTTIVTNLPDDEGGCIEYLAAENFSKFAERLKAEIENDSSRL